MGSSLFCFGYIDLKPLSELESAILVFILLFFKGPSNIASELLQYTSHPNGGRKALHFTALTATKADNRWKITGHILP